MEDNKIEGKLENNNNAKESVKNNPQVIAGAIILAGVLIAGAILLKGNTTQTNMANVPVADITIAPVGAIDRTLGNKEAKVTLVVYEDFQCPYCGRFVQDAEQMIKTNYVDSGKVLLVYRDFAFLGPESIKSAEAARCAGDQGKFWEYHDYLFTHQNGENRGSFADSNLKIFARTLGLNTSIFNQCLGSGKYTKAVTDSNLEAKAAGVLGTPKGFVIIDKDISNKAKSAIIEIANQPNQEPGVSFYTAKNIMSLNGALSGSMVKSIFDIILK